MKSTRTQKKQNSVIDVLKEAILSGDIPGGTELTQMELSESLGVSRMPVREALILLEYQGLVQRLPNNHIRVSCLNPDTIREIFALCATMEDAACRSLPPEALQQLLKEPKQSLQSLLAPQPAELQIHHRLCDTIANPFTQRTLRTMVEIYLDYAVHSCGHNQTEGKRLLVAALSSPEEERLPHLQEYFRNLEQAFRC